MARFSPGEAVQVHDIRPPGHIRTPLYVRGKAGTIERICGLFANPEELAFGRDGLPLQPLYRVRFEQAKLWPNYDGPADDTVEVEIFEHWLDPAERDTP
jgi:nitrile hydratase